MEVRGFNLFFAHLDTTIEEPLEKIVSNQNEIREFFNQFEGQSEVEVTGLYGSLQEVQQSLLLNYKIKSLYNCCNQESKICGIKYQNKALFCLIFNDSFFLKKPLNEKSINLTLFRIFSDLVYHIQVCFKKEVLENWYEGNQMPFCVLQTSTNFEKDDYSSQIQQIEEEKGLIKEEFYEKFMNKSTYVWNSFIGNIVIKKSDVLQNEFQTSFEILAKQFIELKYKNLQDYNYQSTIEVIINQIQSDSVLNNFDVDKQIATLQDVFLKIQKNNINKDIYIQNTIRTQTQELLNKLNFNDQYQFQFQEYEVQIRKDFDDDNFEISFEFKKPNIQMLTRAQDSIFKFSNFNSNLSKFKPTLIYGFKISNSSNLFIFYDTEKKFLVAYVLTKGSTKWNRILEIQNYSNPLFYFSKVNNTLYGFNIKQDQVTLYLIESNKLKNSQQIQICQHYYKQIIFVQVIYFIEIRKFILFGDNMQLYHTCDNFLKLTTVALYDKYAQPIPIYKYSQLLECPSGKYFYLSTGESCEMFDCNYTRILSIDIVGKLMVVPYESNVIILNIGNQSKHMSYVIIKNIIQIKSFKAIQNNKTELIGNPGLDVAKGSLVKFGKYFRYLKTDEQPLKFLYTTPAQEYLKMKSYLEKLKITDFQFLVYNKLLFKAEEKRNFQQYLISRVPITLYS